MAFNCLTFFFFGPLRKSYNPFFFLKKELFIVDIPINFGVKDREIISYTLNPLVWNGAGKLINMILQATGLSYGKPTVLVRFPLLWTGTSALATFSGYLSQLRRFFLYCLFGSMVYIPNHSFLAGFHINCFRHFLSYIKGNQKMLVSCSCHYFVDSCIYILTHTVSFSVNVWIFSVVWFCECTK